MWKNGIKCRIRGKIIMNEMFELEGASLTVHLPGDVDHPVSD